MAARLSAALMFALLSHVPAFSNMDGLKPSSICFYSRQAYAMLRLLGLLHRWA